MEHDYLAPNGSPIIGTKERLTAVASISGIHPSGRPTYTGLVEVDHDTQETARDAQGNILFVAQDGSTWPFHQLVKEAPHGA